ncbi:hypothetical protein IGI39_004042 [Enterococcus sp. AZ135]|uniref:hypothetical protein n=1 Tax=unclassified Enterococcus TaxID=2608891 RepID=UPI003F1EF9CD
MSKTDKELAIDVAIAYIEATSVKVKQNNGTTIVIPFDHLNNIIKTVHKTLSDLEK